MPKVFKPGWTYIYSETLKQEIALNEKTGWIYCQDGTKYSPEEIKEIKKHYGTLPLQVHILKQKFGGVIINDRGTDTNQPAESSYAESGNQPSGSSSSVPRTFGSMSPVEQGQLGLD